MNAWLVNVEVPEECTEVVKDTAPKLTGQVRVNQDDHYGKHRNPENQLPDVSSHLLIPPLLECSMTGSTCDTFKYEIDNADNKYNRHLFPPCLVLS